jgi:hypothetical protein
VLKSARRLDRHCRDLGPGHRRAAFCRGFRGRCGRPIGRRWRPAPAPPARAPRSPLWRRTVRLLGAAASVPGAEDACVEPTARRYSATAAANRSAMCTASACRVACTAWSGCRAAAAASRASASPFGRCAGRAIASSISGAISVSDEKGAPRGIFSCTRPVSEPSATGGGLNGDRSDECRCRRR